MEFSKKERKEGVKRRPRRNIAQPQGRGREAGRTGAPPP